MTDDGRGYVGFTVERNGEQEFFYTEELVAMLLKFGKQLSERTAQGYVKDCVITVPSYFNLAQRKMLLDAAELAGFYVLQLVHENTAAATMFGLDRLDREKDFYVLFYNMGHTDTEVSIVRYSTVHEANVNKTYEYIEVLEEASVRVGGKDLDKTIMDILISKFDNLPERKDKKSIREFPR